jgi:hypothetical protein
VKTIPTSIDQQFCGSYFHGAQSISEKRENFAPCENFPLYSNNIITIGKDDAVWWGDPCPVNIVVWLKFCSMSALYSSIGVPLAGLRLISTNLCHCPDQTLTYECTVMGDRAGATIWTGAALDCPGDEIFLSHWHFTDPYGIIGSCNNGATVARSLSVHDNLYTSQLNVTVTHNVAGKTIVCTYIDGTDITSQFSTQISGIVRAAVHACTLCSSTD